MGNGMNSQRAGNGKSPVIGDSVVMYATESGCAARTCLAIVRARVMWPIPLLSWAYRSRVWPSERSASVMRLIAPPGPQRRLATIP